MMSEMETRIVNSKDQKLAVNETLRDLFAKAALTGICSSGPTISDQEIASAAYDLADAMLAEREK